jgi:phosphate transport system permease protein
MIPAQEASLGSSGLRAGKRRNLKERLITLGLALCAAISAVVTLAILLTLLKETLDFFRAVSIWEFFTETRWTPLFRDKHFGILPLLWGSVLVAAGAALIALPTGLLTAVFLSEYAGERLRAVLKPMLEILAGIPTVVYGYFALTLVTPALRWIFPGTEIFNAAAAAVAIGIMTLPMVAALSEDALRAVPREIREAALALGASREMVTTRIVIPAGLSGILASFVLALSRALGETMVVTIAAGRSPRLTLNPLESIQTLTAYIVQVAQGEVSPGSIEYQTLFAVGMTLLVISLGMNLLSQWVRVRFRGGYR